MGGCDTTDTAAAKELEVVEAISVSVDLGFLVCLVKVKLEVREEVEETLVGSLTRERVLRFRQEKVEVAEE